MPSRLRYRDDGGDAMVPAARAAHNGIRAAAHPPFRAAGHPHHGAAEQAVP